MSSVRNARRLTALLSIGAASLAPLPASALADSGTSAGDQQYVDPLSGSSTSTASHPSSSGSGSGSSSASGSGSSAAPAASSGSSGSISPSSPTLAGGASSSAAGAGARTTSGRTLAFTGYDGGLAVALGSGLVFGGVLLRRRLASTDR